jgi:hypothetical protein
MFWDLGGLGLVSVHILGAKKLDWTRLLRTRWAECGEGGGIDSKDRPPGAVVSMNQADIDAMIEEVGDGGEVHPGQLGIGVSMIERPRKKRKMRTQLGIIERCKGRPWKKWKAEMGAMEKVEQREYTDSTRNM